MSIGCMPPCGKLIDIIYTLGKSSKMSIGDKAPELLGINERGEEVRLSNYKGRKIVLYFYPKDSTSDCTTRACSLCGNHTGLHKTGYEVIGVSVDNEKSHRRFIEKNNLPFTLIADTDKKLVERSGVWGKERLYSRACMDTLYTTFLISEEGVVEQIIGPKEVKTRECASRILRINHYGRKKGRVKFWNR